MNKWKKKTSIYERKRAGKCKLQKAFEEQLKDQTVRSILWNQVVALVISM